MKWPSVIDAACEIVESYDTWVTLRQLFYRLVALRLIFNSDYHYKRLSELTAERRRQGIFPDLIDNTRWIHPLEGWAFWLSWRVPRRRLGHLHRPGVGARRGCRAGRRSTTSTTTVTSSVVAHSHKTLASGSPIPRLWMHKSDDPRNFVGDVIRAHETAEGMAIEGPVRPRHPSSASRPTETPRAAECQV